MTASLKTLACAALAAALALAAASPVQAQDKYPNRPIKIIVPFPPGGPIDVMARLVAQKISPGLGQIIIENRPGGGSTIGLKAAAAADPDGYTFLYGGMMTLSVIPLLSKSLEGDAVKNLAPIALVSSVPFVLVVATRVPANTVQELVAYAKANPGKLNFGAPAGATPLLVGELFKMKAGIDIVTVPYRGAASTVTDLIGGQIDMAFEPTSVVLSHINDTKIRPLALTAKTRNPQLPALPTMGESGLPGVIAESWTGLVAPPGTPSDIVARFNRSINDALKSEDMRLALSKLGGEPVGGSAQDFATHLAAESPKWIEVIKTSGLKID